MVLKVFLMVCEGFVSVFVVLGLGFVVFCFAVCGVKVLLGFRIPWLFRKVSDGFQQDVFG